MAFEFSFFLQHSQWMAGLGPIMETNVRGDAGGGGEDSNGL